MSEKTSLEGEETKRPAFRRRIAQSVRTGNATGLSAYQK